MLSTLLSTLTLVIAATLSNTVLAGGSHGHDKQHSMSPVGMPVADAQATKTIQVTTLDTMRYTYSPPLDINAGDVVTFIVTNKGNIEHEFSIGDNEEQRKHRKMMQAMPDMDHAEGNTIKVKPGETKTITWQFSALKDAIIACNIPGHFEAGMYTSLDK
ncbi:hypothetical protein A9Q99_11755 [Gammaproteobacteria bacterium 45_16_T64]|nr:hypothetical protein A9Q99_11755 [Gammaproteobacteria bacterium 45_16_T64]